MVQKIKYTSFYSLIIKSIYSSLLLIQSLRAFRRTDSSGLYIGWFVVCAFLRFEDRKVLVWRSCCGLEGLKRTTCMPSWLQDGLVRAKSRAQSFFEGPKWPHEKPKRAPRISWAKKAVVWHPFLGPAWVHLGLSWALLGPSWGVQEGILRQMLGLEGLSWGCKVAKE